jgi:hypothetical protein
MVIAPAHVGAQRDAIGVDDNVAQPLQPTQIDQ